MKQSRTLRSLQIAFKKSLDLLKHSPVRNGFSENAGNKYDRRTFILNTVKSGLVIGGAGLVPWDYAKAHPVTTSPRIAIVGGGMAGLNAAYQLSKFGLHATVYEASATLGGRIRTVRGAIARDVYTEVGGEFIDTKHTDILKLARELNLPLYDTLSLSEKRLTRHDYFINGVRYTEPQIIEEFSNIAKRIKADNESLPTTSSYKTSDSALRLDSISIDEYLQNLDVRGWFQQLLKAAFTSEFGLDTGEQSSLNFITMISTDTSEGKFEIFGESDERYKIVGGNDLLIKQLAKRLNTQIIPDMKLESVKSHGKGFVLAFNNSKEINADFVVLAIPFSVLRHVELNIDLTADKIKAIRDLGYGTNSKLVVGFKERVWRKRGYSGYLFNDVVQNGWDHSQLQNANRGEGGYTIFLGGAAGKSLNEQEADRYLSSLNRVYGITSAEYNGQRKVFNWPSNPLAGGSYSCYKVHQWTTISGSEFQPAGKVFFAGEHCSKDFQGYMNGAAETGRRVAKLISMHVGHRRARYSAIA